VVLATQDPMDLDYPAPSNAGSGTSGAGEGSRKQLDAIVEKLSKRRFVLRDVKTRVGSGSFSRAYTPRLGASSLTVPPRRSVRQRKARAAIRVARA
jgi:hypothetical protein